MPVLGRTGTSPTYRGAAAGGRARALLVLAGAGLLVLLLVAGLVGSLTGLFVGEEREAGSEAGVSSGPAAAPGPARPEAGQGGPGAEAALAQSPMLQVPVSATAPHSLSTRTAGPPIALPTPEQVVGSLVPTGFPATEEGALAQLAALMQGGMAGGDPQIWARAYTSLAEPGAAPPDQTQVNRDLVDLRRGANMSPTGPLRDGMTISWTPTSAMVKGSTADGSYTVACVLGEFVVNYQGRVLTYGYGNCLPMRRSADQWWIASGPTAAIAPSAWPGSAEAVAAGWRDILR